MSEAQNVEAIVKSHQTKGLGLDNREVIKATSLV